MGVFALLYGKKSDKIGKIGDSLTIFIGFFIIFTRTLLFLLSCLSCPHLSNPCG